MASNISQETEVHWKTMWQHEACRITLLIHVGQWYLGQLSGFPLTGSRYPIPTWDRIQFNQAILNSRSRLLNYGQIPDGPPPPLANLASPWSRPQASSMYPMFGHQPRAVTENDQLFIRQITRIWPTSQKHPAEYQHDVSGKSTWVAVGPLNYHFHRC